MRLRGAAAWLALAGLAAVQAWAFLQRFPLALGPRFILQPWLMSRGWVPYEDLSDMHTPFLPLLLSFLLRFQPDAALLVRGCLILFLAVTAVLTFAAARRFAGPGWGLWAAAFFILWSPAVRFQTFWYETLLAPMYAVFLAAGIPSRTGRLSPLRWLLLGILGGAAVMVKQHAAAVLAAFAVWNAVTARLRRRGAGDVARETALLLGGALLPPALYLLYHLSRGGTLANFLYWTAAFPFVSGYARADLAAPDPLGLRVMAAAGLLLPAAGLLLFRRRIDAGARAGLAWGLILTGAAALPAWPQFTLFHLQAALPSLAWTSAAVLATVTRPESTARGRATAAAALLSLFWLWAGAGSWRPVFRAGAPRINDFHDELLPMAAGLKRIIKPGEKFFIFPDTEESSNIYYVTGQPPPVYWSYSFRWFMVPRVRERLLRDLRARPPEWVVRFSIGGRLINKRQEPCTWISANYRHAAWLPWKGGRRASLMRRRPPPSRTGESILISHEGARTKGAR